MAGKYFARRLWMRKRGKENVEAKKSERNVHENAEDKWGEEEKEKHISIFFSCREAYTVKVYRQCCWFNLLGVEIGPEIFCSAFPLLLLYLILIFPKPIFFLHFLLLGNFLSTAFVSTISMNMWVLCLYLSSIYYFDMWSKNWLLTHFSTKLLSREGNFPKNNIYHPFAKTITATRYISSNKLNWFFLF